MNINFSRIVYTSLRIIVPIILLICAFSAGLLVEHRRLISLYSDAGSEAKPDVYRGLNILKRRLNLSADQEEKTKQILDQARERAKKLRETVSPEIQALREEVFHNILQVLDQEQRVKLEKIRMRIRQRQKSPHLRPFFHQKVIGEDVQDIENAVGGDTKE